VKSEEHIDDVDATMLRQDVLIPRSFHRRDSRQPRLPSAHHPTATSTTAVVIPPYQNTFTYNNGQDVPPALSDAFRPSISSTTSYSQHVRSYPESSPLSSTTIPQHASLNNSSDRLRTQLPVFGTTSELATHYGIPHKLPPTPNVNNQPNFKPPVPSFNAIPTSSSSTSQHDQLSDWHNQLASYINMVSTNPQEYAEASSSTAVPPVQPTHDMSNVDNVVAASSVMDMLGGTSPHLLTSDMTQTVVSRRTVPTPSLGWDEFLTSPFDDSPCGDFDFLETPLNGAASLGDDFFTSPMVADGNSFDPSFTDLPVFADDEFAKMSVSSMPPPPPPPTSFDGLFTMSPLTPALDASVLPSPQVTDVSIVPQTSAYDDSSTSKKKGPTGTRKNVTPETLVPLDAPTQPRNYVAPSSTSRKELPAVFAKKRARSTAFGDEEDELDDEAAANGTPTGSEADAIAAKRRQNTLAARRSRKRKLEHQRELENAVEAERQDKEMWRGKAMFYEAHIRAMGFQVPYYADEE